MTTAEKALRMSPEEIKAKIRQMEDEHERDVIS
jgi:hypothetical protein